MNNKELACLMFPNVNKTIEDYEKMYPERNLDEGAVVCRMAPSPTGFVHMGSLLQGFINRKVADETNGVFYLRIEDTDQKRTIENSIQGILDDLKAFEIKIDEGVIACDKQIGNYGPYIQSERKGIYETYAKYLVEQGLAYPCFCSEDDLNHMRECQEQKKERIGYYGKYAKCRNLSNEERIRRIKNNEPYIVRLKSQGDFSKRVVLNDLICGKIELPENDLDIVLVKSDGLPLYHFAHVVDDHLMRTTLVMRGQEWIPSTAVHIELFKIFNFKAPKYAHNGLIMKVDEEGIRRKLSKRKDPEAAVSYYHEKGIPVDAVKLYLMTIANSNFEMWLNSNQEKTLSDYKFDFKKMSTSGTLFDVEKMMNISKNYISKLKAKEVFDELLKWSYEFDIDFYKIINKYNSYTTNVLNIEREQKKPRKDFSCYSEIKDAIWYMYDEYFDSKNKKYDWQNINDKKEILNILETYINNYYDINDDKETWFNKMKALCDFLGYASDMKKYKENPNIYKGNIADISMVVRVCLTTKNMTPDLYEIMKLLGKERIIKRISIL